MTDVKKIKPMTKKQVVDDMQNLFTCYDEDTKKVYLTQTLDELAHVLLVQLGCFEPDERKKLMGRSYKYTKELDMSWANAVKIEEGYEWLLAAVYKLCSIHLGEMRHNPHWKEYVAVGRQYRKQVEDGISTTRTDVAYR
jgi:hypothetical protein